MVLECVSSDRQIVGYARTFFSKAMSTMFRERTLSICAIALNALFMKRYDKWRYTETMRGIVLPTFVYVIVWIIYFKDIILP